MQQVKAVVARAKGQPVSVETINIPDRPRARSHGRLPGRAHRQLLE